MRLSSREKFGTLQEEQIECEASQFARLPKQKGDTKKQPLEHFEENKREISLEGIQNSDDDAQIISKLFFLQYIPLIRELFQKLKSKERLEIGDIPQLARAEDGNAILNEIWSAVLKETRNWEIPIDWRGLIFILLRFFKGKILFFAFLMVFQVFYQLLYGFFLQNLLKSLIENKMSEAYFWAGILCGSIGIDIISRNHFYFQLVRLVTKFRFAMITMLYWKVISLNNATIQAANLGKLINIVANDFNEIEFKIIYILVIITMPVILSVFIYILWSLFGWTCLLGMVTFATLLFVKHILFKRNAYILNERNTHSDARVKLCSEVIEGIRLIKMYAWEVSFRKLAEYIRSKEIKALKHYNFVFYIDRALSLNSSYIAALFVFLAHYYSGGNLNSMYVFSFIQYFESLRVSCLTSVASAVSFLFEAPIIFQRVSDILNLKPSLNTHSIEDNLNKISGLEGSVSFINFTAYWQHLDNTEGKILKGVIPALTNININFQKGKLNLIIGKIGSGKSSILLSILREVPYSEGLLNVFGSIAYLEQEPSLFEGTLKENILFGREFEAKLYSDVLRAACLDIDIKEFPRGDLTETGEKGLMISGGQRARICFARALYSKADIYLLDDPLAAVDSRVSKHMFDFGIKEFLKDRTVIMVTHNLQFVREANEIILLDGGKVIRKGSYNDFSKESDWNGISYEKNNTNQLLEAISSFNCWEFQSQQHEKYSEEMRIFKKGIKGEEALENDEVSFSTVKRFLVFSKSPKLIGFLLLMIVIKEVIRFGKLRILGFLGNEDWGEGSIFIFAGILIILNTLSDIFVYRLVLEIYFRADNNMFQSMFNSIIRSPIQFFNENSTGRILNHFSNDTSSIDSILLSLLIPCGETILIFFGFCITVLIIYPIFLVPLVLLILVYYFLTKIISEPIAQTKKLEIMYKGPIFSIFSTTLSNILSIRLCGQEENFKAKFSKIIERNARCIFTFWNLNRVYGVLIETFTFLTSTVGIFTSLMLISGDRALVGQCIFYLVAIIEITNYGFRQLVYSYTIMSSVERNLHYTVLDREDKLIKKGDMKLKAGCLSRKSFQEVLYCEDEDTVEATNTDATSATYRARDWPGEGLISFKNVFLSYSQDSQPALKGITFEIRPGEKVGVVGRTGAGKSTLIQALFRTFPYDNQQGSIVIDGVDINSVGLHTLRTSIAIIPQTPFLFTGSVRKNLDPHDFYSDEEIYKALEEVNLKSFVLALNQGIHTEVSQKATVFSVGQKQLICLARVILRRCKVLILDEATANIDLETDRLIQKKIKEIFKGCTIITIAHRVLTIAGYDRVMVLDGGQLLEFDSPLKLLLKDFRDEDITFNGLFSKIVKQTGFNTSRKVLKLAKKSYFNKKDKQDNLLS